VDKETIISTSEEGSIFMFGFYRGMAKTAPSSEQKESNPNNNTIGDLGTVIHLYEKIAYLILFLSYQRLILVTVIMSSSTTMKW
jgi:hypothetical protein